MAVGHIYREFNRFGVDPQLKNVNIGQILDRNDLRVAEVWMDDYARVFKAYRGLWGRDPGNLTDRHALRASIQCHNFQWYLDNVCRDQYVPPPVSADGRVGGGALGSPDGHWCLTSANQAAGAPTVASCAARQMPSGPQTWLAVNGRLQRASYLGSDLPCLRVDRVAQVDCTRAVRWIRRPEDGSLRPASDPAQCLARGLDAGDSLKLRPCSGTKPPRTSQRWNWTAADRTVASPFRDQCLDNMQRRSGPVGLYPCHGGQTQQWVWGGTPGEDTDVDAPRLLRSAAHAATCVGFEYTVSQFPCAGGGDPDFEWRWAGATLRPRDIPDLCLTRLLGAVDSNNAVSGTRPLGLAPCVASEPEQQWIQLG